MLRTERTLLLRILLDEKWEKVRKFLCKMGHIIWIFTAVECRMAWNTTLLTMLTTRKNQVVFRAVDDVSPLIKCPIQCNVKKKSYVTSYALWCIYQARIRQRVPIDRRGMIIPLTAALLVWKIESRPKRSADAYCGTRSGSICVDTEEEAPHACGRSAL